VTATSDSVLLGVDRSPFLAAVTGHPEAYRAAEMVVAHHEGTVEAGMKRLGAADDGPGPRAPVGPSAVRVVVDASEANPDNLTRN
jgi:hypothetical protein